MSEWIKCSDRSPKVDDSNNNYSKPVLTTDGTDCEIGCYHRVGFWWTEEDLYNPTHWMELPKLPTE